MTHTKLFSDGRDDLAVLCREYISAYGDYKYELMTQNREKVLKYMSDNIDKLYEKIVEW